MHVDKQAIFEEARELMREWYPNLYDKPGACLYWNQVAMRTLMIHGFKPLLQAGTMLWKINDDLDPEACNAFGYQWSPEEPLSQAQLSAGLLPELHIWAGLKETNELIDFSTAYFRQIAEEEHRFKWTSPDPPKFIWGKPPEHALYCPTASATMFAWRFILEKQGLSPRENSYATAKL